VTSAAPPALSIEPFDPEKHDRTAFSCGVDQVDNYFKKTANKLVKADNLRVFVLVDPDGTVMGFYALNAHAVEYGNLPPKYARTRPGHGQIPAFYISMIGVAPVDELEGGLTVATLLVQPLAMPGQTLDSAAHVVQLALTPIFLLAGLAQLINVFTARLGRIADRVYRLAHTESASRSELVRLTLRSRILDGAVLLATLAGALTCCAALIMFLGALRNTGAGAILFGSFGGALTCAIAALAAFAAETILSGRTVREKVSDATDALNSQSEQ